MPGDRNDRGPLALPRFEEISPPTAPSEPAEFQHSIASLRREKLGTELLSQRIEQFEAELKILRTEKRNADLEIVELQALLRTAQARLQQVHDTVSYRLGKIFVDGFTSWRGLAGLPGRLAGFVWLHVGPKFKRTDRDSEPASPLHGASRQVSAVSDALSEVRRSGPEPAAAWARAQQFEPRLLARILLEIARVVRKTDVNLAIALAKEGISLAPSEQRIKWLAFALADAGAISEPAELLRGVIDARVTLNGTETRKADELFALARIAKSPPAVPARRVAIRQPFSRRALLVASKSLPFHWTAATMRLRANAAALRRAGWTPEVMTLPGYPVRDGDDRPLKDVRSTIAGVSYHRLPAAVVSPHMVDLYVGEAAGLIAKFAADTNVSIIHAASDFVTAHAALTAARMIDVPFVLDCAEPVPDVASVSVDAQQSECFGLYRKLQHTLMKEADAVIARTPILQDMLIEGGAATSSVRQLYDCGLVTDGDRQRSVSVTQPALQGRKVIGYLGEGSAEFDLSLLPSLLAKVVQAGVDAALYAVGTGSQFERLQGAANELGLGKDLVLYGRPRLHEIPGHYALMDVVVLPYRSRTWRAPYELMEAMAHGACIVAPDFADVRDIMGTGGLAVRPDGMTDAVIRLLRDESTRRTLSAAAMRRAAQLCNFEDHGHDLLQVYVQAWRRAGGTVGTAPSVSLER